MNLDLATVMQTLALAGTELPAYKALWDQVLGLFSSSDQEELQAAYAAAMEDNDAGHARLQAKLAEAAKRT